MRAITTEPPYKYHWHAQICFKILSDRNFCRICWKVIPFSGPIMSETICDRDKPCFFSAERSGQWDRVEVLNRDSFRLKNESSLQNLFHVPLAFPSMGITFPHHSCSVAWWNIPQASTYRGNSFGSWPYKDPELINKYRNLSWKMEDSKGGTHPQEGQSARQGTSDQYQ